MLKKYVFILLVAISTTVIIGCSNSQGTKTELVYEELSEKESYLMHLTGNQPLLYKLKDIPKDTNYKIILTYEVYEKDKKVKEDTIISITKDEQSEKNEDQSFGLNFQDDKIINLTGDGGSYGFGEYDIKENLKDYSKVFLTQTVPLEIGTETYIYYATTKDGISTDLSLGAPISASTTAKLLNDSNSTILLKLSFKEISYIELQKPLNDCWRFFCCGGKNGKKSMVEFGIIVW